MNREQLLHRPTRHHAERVRETARRLRREGKTVTQIAAELGVPRSTVGGYVRGVEVTRYCLLCKDPAAGEYSNFCSRAHGQKYYATFGPQIQGPFGPMSEAGVGLDCLDCEFQTEDESKADAHFALTGHRIAIDYIDHESEWPS